MTEAMHQPQVLREFLSTLSWKERKGDPAWLEGIRHRAWERFRELGLPTKRLEGWKFTNLEAVLKTPFLAPPAAPQEAAEPARFELDFFGQEEENRLVFLNGFYSKAFSVIKNLPAGAIAEDLASALATEHNKDIQPFLSSAPESEPNAFAHLNTLFLQEGAFLRIPAETSVDRPIHLLFSDSSNPREPAMIHPRVLVVVEEGAKADLVIQILGHSSVPCLMNTVFEIFLGIDARLDCILIEREAEGHFQFFTTRARLSQGSHLGMLTFSHGGRVMRNETLVELAGENASSELRGLSLLHGVSQVSHVVTVHHGSTQDTSRQIYKNILADRAQAEFNSIVRVSPGAQKSDSYQLNRNLLLSDQARAYSRPQLLIYADDVKAMHGSATGRLEKDELFYLRSRGLSEEDARFILTYGFAEEVLSAVHPISLRGQMEAFVKQELVRMITRK